MQHPLVEPAARKAVRDNSLQEHPDWINKIIQSTRCASCATRSCSSAVGHRQVAIVKVLQQAFQSIVVPPGGSSSR